MTLPLQSSWCLCHAGDNLIISMAPETAFFQAFVDPRRKERYIELLDADSGARRKGFREERENDSGVKAKRIPG